MLEPMAAVTSDDPPYLYPEYESTRLRAPTVPFAPLAPEDDAKLRNEDGPRFTDGITPDESDLTRQHGAEPLGERIILTGQVFGADGRPAQHALVEIWQANAGGRYAHPVDDHPAALDPNFTGAGRCVTDGDGRYRFVTVKPGAYPWRNHPNAWRPAHVHFSVFGRTFAERLVTQMYFPADPLFAYDPIYQSVAAAEARDRLVATFDPVITEPEWALGYRWDIALPGHPAATPSQTIGPFFAIGLTEIADAKPGVALSGRVLDGAGAPVSDALLETWDPLSGRFGRCPTDADGAFHFTVEPDHTVWISIFARGLLNRLVTKCDGADGPLAIDIHLQRDEFVAL